MILRRLLCCYSTQLVKFSFLTSRVWCHEFKTQRPRLVSDLSLTGTRELGSSASSMSRRSSDHGQRDWDAERRKGRSLKLWKRPVVRQYLHKGLIWRSSELQEVASFELFVDLLYVGIIAIIGDQAVEHPTGSGLLQFTIVFSIGWKIWSDLQIITSWLGTLY